MNKSMSLYRLVLLLLAASVLAYYNIFFTVFLTYYIILVTAISLFGLAIYVGSVMSVVFISAYLLTWDKKYLEEFKDSVTLVFMCIISPLYLLYIIVIWDKEVLSKI